MKSFCINFSVRKILFLKQTIIESNSLLSTSLLLNLFSFQKVFFYQYKINAQFFTFCDYNLVLRFSFLKVEVYQHLYLIILCQRVFDERFSCLNFQMNYIKKEIN